MGFLLPLVHLFATTASFALILLFSSEKIPDTAMDDIDIETDSFSDLPEPELDEINIQLTACISALKTNEQTLAASIWESIESSEVRLEVVKQSSLETIIHQAYYEGNSRTIFNSITNFIRHSLSQNYKGIAYAELLKGMKSTNQVYNSTDLFSLALFIKMDDLASPKGILHPMIPVTVWSIILGRNVGLWNVKYGGYLYVGGNQAFYNSKLNRRHVLIWKPGNFGNQGRWKFISVPTDNQFNDSRNNSLNNSQFSFRLHSTYWNECLYTDNWENRFDENHRNLFTESCSTNNSNQSMIFDKDEYNDSEKVSRHSISSNSNNNEWNLELVEGEKTPYIRIVTGNEKMETLFAEGKLFDMDSRRKRVFTLLSSSISSQLSISGEESLWRVVPI